jgi:hypothetical protein
LKESSAKNFIWGYDRATKQATNTREKKSPGIKFGVKPFSKGLPPEAFVVLVPPPPRR